MKFTLKRTAVLSVLPSASFRAFCKNKVTDASNNGGNKINRGDFAGVDSATHPWRFANTGDHEPMLPRYCAGGGLILENGAVVHLHHTADKTEGKECLRFTVYRTPVNDKCRRMGGKPIDDIAPLAGRSATTPYSGPVMPGTE
jgi:hypothetical protein